MKVELTDSEIKTLGFYLDKALIDAKGKAAIGFGSRKDVSNLKSIGKKLG